MNNEIKEILDDLGNKNNYIEEFGCQYKRISLYDCFQLLDYITNLQEENVLIKSVNKLVSEKIQEYKQRIDGAIEYIKQRTEFGEYNYAFPSVLNQDEVRKIRNILQGSDKE